MTVPTNWLVPLFWAEMDASRANTATSAYPTCLFGQYLGTIGAGYSADTPYLVGSASAVATIAGLGSELHRKAIAYFANDPTGAVYVVAVQDAGGGTAATGKLTFQNDATVAGTWCIEIGGQKLYLGVTVDAAAAVKVDATHATSGKTPTLVGDALALLLTTHAVTPTSFPVSASNAAGVVTLTAKHKGEIGNDICIKVNPVAGTAGPTSQTCDITNRMGSLAAGALNPTITNAIANTQATRFAWMGQPWTDDTRHAAYTTEFNDTTGRWSYLRQQRGHWLSARMGTLGELNTFATGINDQHGTVVAVEGVNPQPPGATTNAKHPNPTYEIAGAYLGALARILRSDPDGNCQRAQLLSATDGSLIFRAPDLADRFTPTERNTLLNAGLATMVYDDTGACYVEGEVTTYTQTPVSGSADTSYQYVQVLTLSDAWLTDCQTMVESQYATAKRTTATCKAIAGSIVAKYAQYEELGRFEDTDGFADSLSVTPHPTVGNRVEVLAAPVYVNALRIIAFTNRFSH